MSNEPFFQNNYPTLQLEHLIERFENFDDFEQAFPEELLNEDNRIGHYLSQLLYTYNKKDSVVSVEAGLNHSYVNNIVNGRKNNPSRDVLISICFAIGTSFEEAQCLLKYAGLAPLYVRRRRDVIIWYGFLKGETLDTVNELIISRNLRPLTKAL